MSYIDDPADSTAEPWRRALVDCGATVAAAIRNLNESATKIVLLLGADGTLAGTVTDGDIRRGLLRGLTLSSPVSAVANTNPFVVPPEVTRDMVLRLMQVNGYDAIPVVDAERRVHGLHLLNELLSARPRRNLMVVMAGGRGSRLGEQTDHCPKPLLPIGGKPMLEHIIDAARAERFRRFVLATHYLGHMIEDYFGDGSAWSVEIDYIREETPLGTAGALALLPYTPDDAILVTNADVLTDVRYGDVVDFHTRHNADATMAVRQHEWQHPFGVVYTNGVDIVGFEEKPVARTHVNAGIYVLEPKTIELITRGEAMNMPELFLTLRSHGGRTIVYPMHEPWLDVGRVDDLMQAHKIERDRKWPFSSRWA